MNFKILYNLWKAKNTSGPSRLFKNDLWHELEETIPCEIPSWHRQTWFKWSMIGAVCLLVVSSLGTGVYAYNSPEVTENTPLYPVKHAIEKLEEVTMFTPVAKEKFFKKMISRREAEKKVMQKRGQALKKVEEKINKLEDRLNTENEQSNNRNDYILKKNKAENKKSEQPDPDREDKSKKNNRNKK